jgi:hypothetical protein
MLQHFTALTAAALCAWAGWSMRQPGATGVARMLGLMAWAAGTALLDDAFGGLLLGALTGDGTAESTLEQALKSL